MKRNLSYSEFRLFNRNRDEYVRHYVNGFEQEPTPQMVLGSIIHSTIADPRYPWLMELRKLGYEKRKIMIIRKLLDKMATKRSPQGEVGMTATTKSGIKLFSIFDGLDKKDRILYEYKTADYKDAWTQWTVDRHRQLSFYAYVFHLTYHSFFREIRLYFLNTKNATIKTFNTARGIRDIEHIGDEIEKCVEEMKSLGIWEKRLSREDRIRKSMIPLFV